MSTRRLQFGSIALCASLLLGGCAGEVEAELPAAEQSPIAPPTSTAEPTKPALSELVLSPDGVGPLTIGSAPPVTSPTLDTLVFDEDYCVDDSEATAAGLWIPNYEHTDYMSRPFGVLVGADGTIQRIDVTSAEIATSKGIHVGSTVEELTAAYPDGFTQVADLGRVHVYVLTGTSGQLVIEVAVDNGIGVWQEQEFNTVRFIRVVPAGQAVKSVANTDDVVGVCSVV